MITSYGWRVFGIVGKWKKKDQKPKLIWVSTMYSWVKVIIHDQLNPFNYLTQTNQLTELLNSGKMLL